MFATLALRSIKCVNSNLLGNLEFHLAHSGLIAEDATRVVASDCEEFGISQDIAKDREGLRVTR
jgi:hypothetical protein